MLFEKAARLKLRFAYSRGFISAEDLWDLSLKNLNSIAKEIRRNLKAEAEEDYLTEQSPTDTKEQLKFDLVLYVLRTKQDEAKASLERETKKAERQRIMELLAEKQEESLRALSAEQLEAKLKELE